MGVCTIRVFLRWIPQLKCSLLQYFGKRVRNEGKGNTYCRGELQFCPLDKHGLPCLVCSTGVQH